MSESATPVQSYPSWWTELDSKAVDTARLLAADAVQKVGNGHPGTAMSLAPLSYLLFQRVMRHDPLDLALDRRGLLRPEEVRDDDEAVALELGARIAPTTGTARGAGRRRHHAVPFRAPVPTPLPPATRW